MQPSGSVVTEALRGEGPGPLRDPEVALALAYAPAETRPALAALWRLDERLGRVVASTRESGLGQIKLAWWRDALGALDKEEAPAEPLLAEVAAAVLPRGVTGVELSGMAEGWEHLLAAELDDAALEAFARERGGALFTLAARLLGGDVEGVGAAGEVWALTDFAAHVRDRDEAARARALAASRTPPRRWPRRLRPLGMLARLAALDSRSEAPRRQGSPGRVARMLLYGATGL